MKEVSIGNFIFTHIAVTIKLKCSPDDASLNLISTNSLVTLVPFVTSAVIVHLKLQVMLKQEEDKRVPTGMAVLLLSFWTTKVFCIRREQFCWCCINTILRECKKALMIKLIWQAIVLFEISIALQIRFRYILGWIEIYHQYTLVLWTDIWEIWLCCCLSRTTWQGTLSSFITKAVNVTLALHCHDDNNGAALHTNSIDNIPLIAFCLQSTTVSSIK